MSRLESKPKCSVCENTSDFTIKSDEGEPDVHLCNKCNNFESDLLSYPPGMHVGGFRLKDTE